VVRKLVLVVVVLALAGGSVVAYDAGRPGVPIAEINGSGTLRGWVFTYEGDVLCDDLVVNRATNAITCGEE
jgi:hypothetical protein